MRSPAKFCEAVCWQAESQVPRADRKAYVQAHPALACCCFGSEQLAKGFHLAAEPAGRDQCQTRSSPQSLYGLTSKLFVGCNQPAIGQRNRRWLRAHRSFFDGAVADRYCAGEPRHRSAVRFVRRSAHWKSPARTSRSCVTNCISSGVSLCPDRGPRFWGNRPARPAS